MKRKVAITVSYIVFLGALALSLFQVYSTVVNFTNSLKRFVEELDKTLILLEAHEARLKELESRKEKISNVESLNVTDTLTSDQLRELLIKFFSQDVLDVQLVSINCNVTEPVIYERKETTYSISIRSGVTTVGGE